MGIVIDMTMLKKTFKWQLKREFILDERAKVSRKTVLTHSLLRQNGTI